MGERSADGFVRAIKVGCNTRTKPSALHFAKDSGKLIQVTGASSLSSLPAASYAVLPPRFPLTLMGRGILSSQFHTVLAANPAKLTERDFSEFYFWPLISLSVRRHPCLPKHVEESSHQ